jgi:NADH-quinone oxidoreductase subunit H
MGFALFFLAEYSNIILISSVAGLLFLGGWFPIADIIILNWIPGSIYFAIKTIFFMILFIIVRAILPRYRYDQLMRIGWKVFLPIALSLAFFYGSTLLSFNGMSLLVK